jgi:hypothetical protein
MNKITTKKMRENPDWIFVFGDNLIEKGLGGLAKICRPEPNSFGIATKRYPARTHDSYFYESDFEEIWPIINKKLFIIEEMLKQGKIIVFPKKGIGNNLAKLDITYPLMYKYIHSKISMFSEIYGKRFVD